MMEYILILIPSFKNVCRRSLMQVLDAVQRIQKVMNERAATSDKLEASLRDLARTGNVATCKAARKEADAKLKDTNKDLKAILDSLPASSRSTVLAKVCFLNLSFFRCSVSGLYVLSWPSASGWGTVYMYASDLRQYEKFDWVWWDTHIRFTVEIKLCPVKKVVRALYAFLIASDLPAP